MKKLSLMGVGLVVLLMAMTGVASAEVYTLGYTNEEGYDIPAEAREVIVEVTGPTVVVTYNNSTPGTTGIHWIALNLNDSAGVPGVVSVDWPDKAINSPGFDPVVDKINGWPPYFGAYNVNLSLPTAVSERTYGPVTIVFDGPVELVPNYAAVQLISLPLDGERSAKVYVPEFPTVALPIAAVIGLAFIFMRRKGKLEQ